MEYKPSWFLYKLPDCPICHEEWHKEHKETGNTPQWRQGQKMVPLSKDIMYYHGQMYQVSGTESHAIVTYDRWKCVRCGYEVKCE